MRFARLLTFSIVCLGASALARPAATGVQFAGPNATRVTVSEGVVQGGTVDINGTTTRQWFGVPYGADTGGANRFQPPKARSAYSGVRDATQVVPACAQRRNANESAFLRQVYVPDDYPTNEDCLSVNIFAPSGARANGSAAVMVFVPGGAFQFGSPNFDIYHGNDWVAAQDDVIIVTVNHRLSVFGFPQAQQLNVSNSGSMNLGLLDVKAAFDWLYSNIAAFGGDPERIVGFGQSAGGIAVDTLSFAYPNTYKVKGLLTLSGVAASFANSNQQYIAVSNFTDPASGWNTLANGLGCGNVSDATQLKCMQSISLDKMTSAVRNSDYNFQPVPDEVTFFADFGSRLRDGKFLRVPYLTNTNTDEATIFAKVKANGSDTYYNPLDPTNIVTSIWFCAAYQAAKGRALNGVRAWQTRYAGNFPQISPDPTLGAYHTAELPILFGTYNKLTSPKNATEAQILTSRYLQSAYTAFGRNPQTGLDSVMTSTGMGLQANTALISYYNEIARNNRPIADRAVVILVTLLCVLYRGFGF